MSFPETRKTLIARLASEGTEADWQQFSADYWGPVVRFVGRIGRIPIDQAEDVAGELFVVLLRSPLLGRWQQQPSARLRSLLCGIARNLLSNRQRVELNRRRLLHEAAAEGVLPAIAAEASEYEPAVHDLDAFYRAWVDELLAETMRSVMSQFHAEGKGDYFRALYGRICEGLTAAEIGAALNSSPSIVENYLRVAKARLARALSDQVRQHVQRYSKSEDVVAEFEQEWAQLSQYLEKYGGLDEAIRQEVTSLDRLPGGGGQTRSFQKLQKHIQKVDSSIRPA